MNGYSFKCEHLFYFIFKKHYCPKCGNKLLKEKVSKIVNSNSPEAKEYDFEVADIPVKGDMNFTHVELYCNQCNKYYTIKEAKKNKF